MSITPVSGVDWILRIFPSASFIALIGLSVSTSVIGATTDDTGVEEQRLVLAKTALVEVVDRYPMREIQWGSAQDVAAARTAAEAGRALWRSAVRDVQEGNLDDRPLYWSRLAGRVELQAMRRAPAEVEIFEQASRGFNDLEFPPVAGTRRVLISGFDPFLLDRDIGQSNPSGLSAMALDGLILETEQNSVWIEAVVFPVRFGDFDNGLVENFFTNAIASHSIDLIVTISMGRDAFDLERFPGRRRSAAAPDNRNVVTGADAETPLIPKLGSGSLEGPEFVEFSLPVAKMLAIQNPWPVRDNRRVTSLERGLLEPSTLAELTFDTAVQGSGGGYLSNEISYRSVLLVRRMGSRIPIGHLHTPAVVGHDAEQEGLMLAQIRALLVAAVSNPDSEAHRGSASAPR